MSTNNKEAAEREAFEEWREENRHLDGYDDLDECMLVAYLGGRRDALEPSEAPAITEQAPPLPKWIDDQKGKDPVIDDLIAYTEQQLAKIAALRSEQAQGGAQNAQNQPESRASAEYRVVPEQAPAGEVSHSCAENCGKPGCDGPDGELTEEIALRERLAQLLAGVAVALKGEELPRHRHSYHDLPEVATVLRLERDLLKVQVEELRAALSTPPAVPQTVMDLLRSGDLEPILMRAGEEEMRLMLYRCRQLLSAAPAAPQPKEQP